MANIREIQQQIIVPTGTDTLTAASLREMTLAEALAVWLPSRQPFISQKTHHEYRLIVKRLAKEKIGPVRLRDLNVDHVRQHQTIRLAQGCGPHGINHEGSVIQQVLKRAGLWKDFEFDYQPLPLPRSEVGVALTDEEQARLLRVSASKPRWQDCHLFLLLSFHTTCGPKEIMTLRRKDVDLEHNVLFVNAMGAKNKFRIRPIPLNAVARDVCLFALELAEKRGSVSPEHFIFPFRSAGNATGEGTYDPTRPRTSFKGSWNQIRIAAGLGNMRMYTARHTAITRLYEDPTISAETVEQIAGHHGPAMKRLYAHIRVDAKRTALSKLVPQLPENPAPSPAREKSEARPRRTGPAMTNDDVLGMLEMEFPTKIICAKIKHCRPNFDLSNKALKTLKDAGAHNDVIFAMVEAE